MPSITNESTLALVARRADQPRARDLGEQALGRVLEQRVLVSRERAEVDALEIVDRRAEPNGARDVRRARLELVGQRVVGGAVEATP